MALPRCEQYKLVESYRRSGLEDAESCANCGRPIVEVAVVRDSVGNLHRIGTDCAATLTSIADSHAFRFEHLAAFADATSFQRALRKARRLNPAGSLSVHEYAPGTGYYRQGGFLVDFGAPGEIGHFSKNYPEHLKPYILPLTRAAVAIAA